MDPFYRDPERGPQKPQISQLYQAKSRIDQKEARRDDQLLPSADLRGTQEIYCCEQR